MARGPGVRASRSDESPTNRALLDTRVVTRRIRAPVVEAARLAIGIYRRILLDVGGRERGVIVGQADESDGWNVDDDRSDPVRAMSLGPVLTHRVGEGH